MFADCRYKTFLGLITGCMWGSQWPGFCFFFLSQIVIVDGQKRQEMWNFWWPKNVNKNTPYYIYLDGQKTSIKMVFLMVIYKYLMAKKHQHNLSWWAKSSRYGLCWCFLAIKKTTFLDSQCCFLDGQRTSTYPFLMVIGHQNMAFLMFFGHQQKPNF